MLGFTLEVALGTYLVIGMYHFLLYTTLIQKLEFIEHLFVTPSYHRAHHGSTEEYLDKIYAGILIIWIDCLKRLLKKNLR